jgi:Tfp pilus assembly protein PilN
MINLLPPELKQEYHYARRNTSLWHIVGLFGVGLFGLMLLCALGVIYLNQTTSSFKSQAKIAAQSLVDQKQNEVEKTVQGISSNLKLAVQVLSQEVLFSQLLKQLAVSIPANANLTGLSITDVRSGVDITARTVDYNTATQLQVNLADPANKIFAKADIVSITCVEPASGSSTKYPCTIVIRASFVKDNPFLFINNRVKK